MRKFDVNLLPASPDLRFEKELWFAGCTFVVGVDEAGRGALAGPVVAAALVLPVDENLPQLLDGVRDSKEMSPKARSYWAQEIRRIALDFGVGFGTQQEIDTKGIVPATRLAMQRALMALQVQPQHCLLDYMSLEDYPVPQTSLVKGDARSLTIAGASVLAKTTRDDFMVAYEEQYPGYGFASHKGYGTRAHREAIQRLGPSSIHRLSFRVDGQQIGGMKREREFAKC